MLEIMYDIPSEESIKEVVITEELIVNGAQPILVYKTEEEIKAEAEASKKSKEFGTGGALTNQKKKELGNQCRARFFASKLSCQAFALFFNH